MATGEKAGTSLTNRAEKRYSEEKVNPVEVARTIGICRRITGEYTAAEEHFKKVAEANPADLNSWRLLCDLLQLQGKTKEVDELLAKLGNSTNKAVAIWSRRLVFLNGRKGVPNNQEICSRGTN